MTFVILVGIIIALYIYINYIKVKNDEEQGKIIKREKNFIDEREIFSSKTLEWEEIKKALDELDLSEIKRLKVTKYDNYYKYSQDYVKYGWIAIFEYIGKSDNISRYQLYISSYRNGGVEHYINMLFTTIEKMLIELDPDIELKKEVIKRKTKRSFF